MEKQHPTEQQTVETKHLSAEALDTLMNAILGERTAADAALINHPVEPTSAQEHERTGHQKITNLGKPKKPAATGWGSLIVPHGLAS